MKHFQNTSRALLLTLLAFPLCCAPLACGAQTLDGGSNAGDGASGASGGPGSEAPSGGSGEGAIPDTPIDGSIAGKPFAPKSIELQFSKASNQWFLTLRNYDVRCSVLKEKPAGPDALIVTVGSVEAKSGSFPIALADGHGASFQVGLYDGNGPKPATEPADEGTLRLDSWTDKPGETVTGALRLANGESEIAGTFTATVCAAK